MKKERKTEKSQVDEQSDSKVNKWHLPLIAAIAIIVRIIYDINLSADIFLNSYHLDSLVLHSWALDILRGTTANLAFFRAPLYPYLLALLYKLFSVSPWPVIIFQNLLGVLTATISYKYTRFLFGSRIAFWSGIVVAIYPTLLIFEGETMITTMEVLLYTLAIYLMHLAVERLDKWRIVNAGIVLGLAAITRPIILPLAIIFPIALLVKLGKKNYIPIISKSVIFGLAAMISILPVALRNIIKGNELVLISTQGGANFYIGNCKDADGITVVALGPQLRGGGEI